MLCKMPAKLAENSAIFEAISPDMDITQATDGLVSIIKAYDLDVEDSLDGIISKVNEVGNKVRRVQRRYCGGYDP